MKSGLQSIASSEARREVRYERVTSRAKTDAVLRVLNGDSVAELSQELGVSIGRIERWKDRFVQAGTAELARRQDEPSIGWVAKHSSSIWQWIWLLLALVALVSFLAVFMQRTSLQ
jgi:hypothetical protein